MTEPLVREVADRLIAYMGEHPRASDTLDGIHQWWLSTSAPGATREVTQHALELLEAEGHIERHAFVRCTVWRRVRARCGPDTEPAP